MKKNFIILLVICLVIICLYLIMDSSQAELLKFKPFIIIFLIPFLISYLVGSFPTGYVIVKLAKNQDIRTIGSGSTGATNVKRAMGKKCFFIVLLLDAFKGALPVLLAKSFELNMFTYMDTSMIGVIPVVAAIAVIIGHSKSVFLDFSGGKSVASGVGTILALEWHVGVIIAIIWATITYFSRYVSLGSIIAVALAPILMHFFNQPFMYILYCAIGAAYIIYLHRENINRLIHGVENKVR